MAENNPQKYKLLKSNYLIPRDIVLYALIFILGLVIGFLIGNKNYLESANLFIGIILLVIYIAIIYLYVIRLIKLQKSEQQKLEYKLSTDQLTKLYNKEYFYGLFEIELSRSYRYRRNLCCLLLEIDGIHDIFEHHGDKYGDRIIKETAELLKENSRFTDILGRFDGYQFICLLTETEIESTLILCKRLRSLLSSEEYETEDGRTIFITPSMGVTDFNPDVNKEVDIYVMIKAARKALDLAKERGGNRIEYYEILKILTS